MRTVKAICVPVLLMVMLMLVPANSWAGGLALYEISSTEVGLASAGIAARAQDPSTLFSNPAGMSMLDNSELMVNVQPFYVLIDLSVDENTTVPGGNGGASTWDASGSIYYVHNLSPGVKLGLGLLNYFGLGIDYGSTWSGRYYLEDAMLVGLTVMPAVSYRINKSFSIGAGINAMYGILDQSSSVYNPIQNDGKLTVEDTDWGYGVNLGLLFEQNEGTRYGLTYMSQVDLDFDDTPTYTGPDRSFGSLLNLISRLDMGMTVPQMIMASAYHELDDKWAVMGNVGWQDWSEFGKINTTAAVNIPDTGAISQNIDMDYDDSWHVAFGAQYRLSDVWLFSGGLAYDTAIVDDDNRSLDLPNGDTWRFGMGARHQLRENIELGAGYELAWSGDLSVAQETRVGNTVVRRVSGEFQNAQMHFFTVSAKWRF